MPRNFSFWLLLGLVGLFALLLFRIVQPFIIALFVPAVVGMLFKPLHQWLTRRLRGHHRIAAGATTLLVLLLVLLPISFTLMMAGTQVLRGGQQVASWFDARSGSALQETLDEAEETTIGSRLTKLYADLPIEHRDRLRHITSQFADGAVAEIYENTRKMLSDVFSVVMSLSVMTLALYYALADRDLLVRYLHRMLPLQNSEEKELATKYERICRGVVLGTVVAGVVQAALAGLAFAVLGIPQIWLLIVLSMLCSFIPFIGSAAVWGSVALWLLVEGRYGAAIGLVAYGSVVIATSDNLVRAHLIGNQASLHPLISLVTVLGAIKLMGLWGVFVGPMVAAFFFSLLTIAHERYIQQNGAVAQQNGDPWDVESGCVESGSVETSQSIDREGASHSVSASEHHA